MWFVLRKARELSTGAQGYGFLGDGSLHVPYIDVGTGIKNQRQIVTTGASVSVPRQILVNTDGMSLGGYNNLGEVATIGAITDPMANLINNGGGG